MRYQEEKRRLKPWRCPMPVPIICLDDELRHFVERFREQFSKPQYQYFVTVRLRLMLCEGRRTLSGLLREVGEHASLAGLGVPVAIRQKPTLSYGKFQRAQVRHQSN